MNGLDAALLDVEVLAEHRALPRRAAWCPHRPHPRQREFLELGCLESLYGGAAGGGKSDALLMAALRYVDVPGYAALVLRRTYADLSLTGAIMDRANGWLRGTDAKWNGVDHRWTFPSGATLQFGYADTETDIHRYKSAEYQFIAVDEVTEWPESWYTFLASRLRRRARVEVPLRLRCATNPGGIGHEWVRRRFGIQEGQIIHAPIWVGDDRCFVPARLEDNPSVDIEAYEKSLRLVSTIQHQQFREGRWVRDVSGLVYAWDPTRNGLAHDPGHLDHYVLGIDYGHTDATAFAILGWRKHDPTTYVVRCFKRTKLSPSSAAEVAQELERTYGFVEIVGDIGGLGKGYVEEARERFSLPIEAAEKHNKLGYIDLLNGDLTGERLKVVTPGCAELVAEWSELPWKDKERTKEAPGFENHCADATLYAWRASKAWGERPEAEAPAYGSPEFYRAQAETDRERRRSELEKARTTRSGWQAFRRGR